MIFSKYDQETEKNQKHLNKIPSKTWHNHNLRYLNAAVGKKCSLKLFFAPFFLIMLDPKIMKIDAGDQKLWKEL